MTSGGTVGFVTLGVRVGVGVLLGVGVPAGVVAGWLLVGEETGAEDAVPARVGVSEEAAVDPGAAGEALDAALVPDVAGLAAAAAIWHVAATSPTATTVATARRFMFPPDLRPDET